MRIAPSILLLVPGAAVFPTGSFGTARSFPTASDESAPAAEFAVPLAATPPQPAMLSAVPAGADFAIALHDSAGLLRDLPANAWSRLLHDERLWGPAEGSEVVASRLLHLLGPLGSDGALAFHRVMEVAGALVFVAEFEAPRDPLSPGSDSNIALALVARPGSDTRAFDAAWAELLELGREDSAGAPEADPEVDPGADPGADPVPAAPERLGVGGWSAFSERTAEGDALIVLARSAESLPPFAAAIREGLEQRRDAPSWVRDARESAPAGAQFELVARPDGIPWSHLGLDEQGATLLHALGVDGIRWAYVGGHIGSDEEFDLNVALHVPADTTLSAMLAALRPVDPALYRLVPADAITASFSSVDVRGLWGLAMGLLDDHFPEQAMLVESSFAEVEEQLGVDPLEDLLFLFAGDSIEWTTAASADGLPASTQSATRLRDAVVATLSDSERFEESLAALLDAVGISLALEVHDHGHHEVTSLGLEAGKGGVVWAFPTGALVFGSEEAAVHAALDRWDGRGEVDTTSLLDHPVLGARVRSAKDAFHVAVYDTAAVLREVLKALAALEELLDGELTLGLQLGSFTLPFPALVDEYIQGSVLVQARRESERVVLRIAGR